MEKNSRLSFKKLSAALVVAVLSLGGCLEVNDTLTPREQTATAVFSAAATKGVESLEYNVKKNSASECRGYVDPNTGLITRTKCIYKYNPNSAPTPTPHK